MLTFFTDIKALYWAVITHNSTPYGASGALCLHAMQYLTACHRQTPRV